MAGARSTLGWVLLLGSCAPAPASPEPPGVARPPASSPGAAAESSAPTSAPSPDAGETDEQRRKRLATELDSMEMRPIGAAAGSPPAAGPAVAHFLAAANSDDDASARVACTPACWDKECGRFARQAGRKFQARATGDMRLATARAVAGVDVICESGQKCDFVHLLLELTDGTWRVGDVTESDEQAAAWLR